MRVRRGKEHDIAPPSEMPSSAARSVPAESSTARTSSIRVSRSGSRSVETRWRGRCRAFEEDEPPHRREPPVKGCQLRVFPARLKGADQPWTRTRSTGPVDDLVCDPDGAASGIRDIADGSLARCSACRRARVRVRRRLKGRVLLQHLPLELAEAKWKAGSPSRRRAFAETPGSWRDLRMPAGPVKSEHVRERRRSRSGCSAISASSSPTTSR